MKVHAKDIARATVDLLESTPTAQHEALCDAALALLERHGLRREVQVFPRILKRLLMQRDRRVSFRTPSGHTGAAGKTIAGALEKALGHPVIFEEEADPDLLGGALLTVGDERLDASLRGALRTLEAHLTVSQ